TLHPISLHSLPFSCSPDHPHLPSFPTRRSSDLATEAALRAGEERLRHIIASASDGILSYGDDLRIQLFNAAAERILRCPAAEARSEEHTSELQSRVDLVCRLLLEKKKTDRK